ncbi:MAG TPA: tRNA (adenosine(37)-N6)-threonylcarbamoyltransferase complex transferase subunit TsaD [Deltaproteobacteria bacterium]|nr:tRNA (adenosine(37)-N6)-threonylcarbamoyltransferase complex transferase subunit TsaD [Deltaproteobacteria bacterium]
MLVFGIETSCDETAAAVVKDGKEVLSNIVSSQISVHSPFGGVVPELAARHHLEAIIPVMEKALDEASISFDRIDLISVTQGPGLIGALLVGISAAKALCYVTGIPLIGVDHLYGHIQSAFFAEEPVEFPLILLVVSGGHTSLFYSEQIGSYRLLGNTRDDAAGEAFDKVAKMLGLGYPGGIIIDRLAGEGNPSAFHFPRAFLGKKTYDFSFSGIKTAVVNFIRDYGMPSTGHGGTYRLEDLAASFQEAVVDMLLEKSFRAAEDFKVKHLAIVGGVAANSRLRKRFLEEGEFRGIKIHLAPLNFCTDNAAMIAAAGYHRFVEKGPDENPLEFEPYSRRVEDPFKPE